MLPMGGVCLCSGPKAVMPIFGLRDDPHRCSCALQAAACCAACSAMGPLHFRLAKFDAGEAPRLPALNLAAEVGAGALPPASVLIEGL